MSESFKFVEKPTHSSFRDLEGQKFHRLTVLGFCGVKWRNAVWVCMCDCGTAKPVKSSLLIQGKTKSCGCLKLELLSGRVRQHGQSHQNDGRPTAAYGAWCNMKTRCYNSKRKCYHRYGGRGITMCKRWLESFESFVEDMGEPPHGHSVDRIDNDGNYEPGNCRWATTKEQCNNTRRNRTVIIDGIQLTARQAAEKFGVSEFTIYGRLNRGLTNNEAVFGTSK